MSPTSPNPQLLWRRDVAGTVGQVKDSLSSWDGCMSVSYCKWPVISGIIIGSLIIISVIWCCCRCLFCGAQCCCGCLSCCNSCCPGPRKKKGHEPLGDMPPVDSQYTSHQLPTFSAKNFNKPPPQFATFDVSSGGKKYNEDALPAMPSWGDATSRRIEEEEEVPLKKPSTVAPTISTDDASRNNSANPSTGLMSDVDHSRGPTPNRSPAFDEYGFPGQRPSPPPASQSYSQNSRLPPPPPQGSYGHSSRQASPGPVAMRSPSPGTFVPANQPPARFYGAGASNARSPAYQYEQQQQQQTPYQDAVSPSVYSSVPPSYHTTAAPPPTRRPVPNTRSPSARPMQPPGAQQSYFPPMNERVMHNNSPYAANASYDDYDAAPQQAPPPAPLELPTSPYQAYNPHLHSPR